MPWKKAFELESSAKRWIVMLLTVGVIVFAGRTSAFAEERSDRSVLMLGKSARIAADEVVDFAIVVGGNLAIEGRVRGLAAAVGGDLEVAPGARVGGSVMAVGGDLAVADDAHVGGARAQVAAGDLGSVLGGLAEATEAEPPPLWAGPVMRAMQVVALFVLAMGLVLILPRQVLLVRQALVQRSALSTIAGVALLLGFVPLCAVLGFSFVGIPLIAVAVSVLAAAIILGMAAVASTLGGFLPQLRDEPRLFGALAVGMLVLGLLALIPVAGGAILLLAGFYGAGGVLVSRFGTHAPVDTVDERPKTATHAPAI